MERGQVREGMQVYSLDGERLGKVVQCSATSFLIEKGIFFKKDYVAAYEDVGRIVRDELHLQLAAHALLPAGPDAVPASATTATAEGRSLRAGVVPERREGAVAHERTKETRIPVADEKLPVSEAEAHFEEGDMVVPVREEEVEVRKRPVVREAARGSRAAHEEQRAASGTVRRETVEVDESKDDEATRRRLRNEDDDPNTRR